jgi:cyclomaltodextrinase
MEAHDVLDWVRDAIFYEIFPDRFANGDPGNDPPNTEPWGSDPTRENFCGGDLKGIIDNLAYLEDLGINVIYMTPVFKANANHKYDTCDYLEVDPSFGTNDLLSTLVSEAHTRGIRIILDAVFNHCGNGFWAFEDVIKNEASSRYADWFFVNSYPIVHDPPNYQTCGGAWTLPKINLHNTEARDYILKAATYWIEECDIDGWRLDVPWKVPHEFWHVFRDKVKSIKPDCYIVGEAWRDPKPWSRGDICDGVMNYELRDIVLTYCAKRGMDAEDFEYDTRTLRESLGIMAPYQMNLLGSHDTSRLMTVFDGDIDRVILAYTFMFTYIGAPMIYYGDEIGMIGDDDPGCRRCMSWEEETWNTKIYQTCCLLSRTRKRHSALRMGNFTSLLTFNGVFSYLRQYGDDEVVVVLNPREDRCNLRIPLLGLSPIKKVWRDLFSGKEFPNIEGKIFIDDLPSCTALVLTSESRDSSLVK